MSLSDRLTNSQISCAATCLRKHCISYLHGIRPDQDATPLRFGRAWHEALDRRACGMEMANNLAKIGIDYEAARTPETSARMDYEMWTICTLLRLYDWRWAGMDCTMPVDASEEAFEVPIINPETGHASRTFSFCGKIDRLIRLADGRPAVMECKTTSDDISPDSDYWRRLRVDTQIARYVLAAQSMGHPIDTVLYDVVRKPSMRPCQVPLTDEEGVKIVLDDKGNRVKTKDGKKWRETGDVSQGYVLQTRPEAPEEWGARLHADIIADPDRYFARREIPRTAMDLIEARQGLWDYAQVLHRCDTEGRWPRNSQACIGFGRCPYLDLCSTNWSPEDSEAVPAGFMRVSDPHQELI